jgi:hypothetical protein
MAEGGSCHKDTGSRLAGPFDQAAAQQPLLSLTAAGPGPISAHTGIDPDSACPRHGQYSEKV